MRIIDQDTLRSFFGNNNQITGTPKPAGNDSAILQAEDLAYQHTGIPFPAKIADANPTVQFIAHSFFVYLTSTRYAGLSAEELSLRKDMYNKALELAREIKSGKLKLYDSSGVLLNTPVTSDFYANAENRSERI